jgi:long-chain fatty acid transport protein
MGMSQKTRFTQSALAVAVALVSTQAWSAGFQLNEFSSSGLGRAYSGEGAIADDAGNASRNPALIMMFDRPTMSAGAIFIDPDVNISGKSPSGKSLNATILRQPHGCRTSTLLRRLTISLVGGFNYL